MDNFSVTFFVAKNLATKQSTTKLPFTLALYYLMNFYVKSLRRRAQTIIAKGLLFLLVSLLVSSLFMPVGLLFFFICFFGAVVYVYAKIANITCPSCHNSYGVGLNFMGMIEVPSRCICCRTSAL